jgi:hypothetical protein
LGSRGNTGVVDTGGNLPPASLTTTQGKLVAKFAAGVVDTGGKFAAGVVDTGGNLPPVSLTPVACEYLREFSKKFEMILMLLYYQGPLSRSGRSRADKQRQ